MKANTAALERRALPDVQICFGLVRERFVYYSRVWREWIEEHSANKSLLNKIFRNLTKISRLSTLKIWKYKPAKECRRNGLIKHIEHRSKEKNEVPARRRWFRAMPRCKRCQSFGNSGSHKKQTEKGVETQCLMLDSAAAELRLVYYPSNTSMLLACCC